MKQAGLTIVVPTLNEAENISSLLTRIHNPLAAAQIPHEILIIDDHSTDDTIKLAHEAPSRYCVRVLSKQGAQGKAFSLLEGFDAAEHDLVAMIDGDLQYPPEAIKPMYDTLRRESMDVVLTERVQPKTSALRRLSTYIFNLLFARLLFGIKYDTQSGLKLFRKSILKQYQLDPSPWSFDLEFIVRAIENKHRITSHQINFSERQGGKAKLHTVSATIELIRASVRLRRDSSIKRFGMGNTVSQPKLRMLRGPIAIFAGVLCAMALANTLSPTSASALALPSTGNLVQTVQNALGIDNDSKKAKTQANNAPVQTQSSTSTDPTDTSSDTPTTPAVDTSTSSTVSSPSTTNTSSATPATSAPTSSASTASTATTNSSGNSVAKSAASAANTTKPTQATVTDDPTKGYYNTSPLSNKKHNMLTSFAKNAAIVGGALVIVAGLITLIRSMTNSNSQKSQQPERFSAQQSRSFPTSS